MLIVETLGCGASSCLCAVSVLGKKSYPSRLAGHGSKRAAARAHLEQGRRGPGHLTPRMPTLLVRDERVVLLVGVLHHLRTTQDVRRRSVKG
eukprot:scaffold4002_cov123-Isochrysis_galbana.AAC.9